MNINLTNSRSFCDFDGANSFASSFIQEFPEHRDSRCPQWRWETASPLLTHLAYVLVRDSAWEQDVINAAISVLRNYDMSEYALKRALTGILRASYLEDVL